MSPPVPDSPARRPLLSPNRQRDQFRLSDPELRVTRIACSYLSDSAKRTNLDDLDANAWSGLEASYRPTLIALWTAGRNGGWIEERHAQNLYFAGLYFLTRRDLPREERFTVEEAAILDEVTKRLGRMIASAE